MDLDGVAAHLLGYGFRGGGSHPDPVYDRGLPRLVEELASVGLRATFFAVAATAARHAGRIREAAAAGHEVASHSDTHPQPFSTLEHRALEREVAGSRARLQDLLGHAVDGFRAPGWDAGPPVLDAVARAGYAYDASIFPSPALVAVRLLVRHRGLGRRIPLGLRHHLLATARPHRRRAAGRELVEIPAAALPLVRVPVYHTTAYALPVAVADVLASLHRASRGPLPYLLHGIDLVEATDPGMDPRLGRHPGMRLSLRAKRELLFRRLSWIGARYRCVTMSELARETPPRRTPLRGDALRPGELAGSTR